MNDTSKESYLKCIEEGLITRKNKRILRAFAELGCPTSAGYISSKVPGAWKNFYLLVEMGALVRLPDTVWDPNTMRKVHQYYFPQGPLPPLKERKQTRKIAAREAFLEGALRMRELMDNEVPRDKAMEMLRDEAPQ